MSKDVRLSVRVAQSGADVLNEVVAESQSDLSKVTREFLMVGVTSPAIRRDVVKRLKQRKGLE